MIRPTFENGKYESVVICAPPHTQSCGRVVLTQIEYSQQMNEPDEFWKCPVCGSYAVWDEINFDAWLLAPTVALADQSLAVP